jgi:hypothetical protein
MIALKMLLVEKVMTDRNRHTAAWLSVLQASNQVA